MCSDGTPAMLGNKSGFSANDETGHSTLKVSHNFLHRHALASEALPTKLKRVLNISVTTIN